MYTSQTAEWYDHLYGSLVYDREFYLHFLQQQCGRSLEIGVGTGRLFSFYTSLGYDVAGCDESSGMIDVCARKLAARGLSAELYLQRMQELSLPDRYSTIYAPGYVMMHLLDCREQEDVMKRLYEHVLPGGTLLVSCFVAESSNEAHDWLLVTSCSYRDGFLYVYERLSFVQKVRCIERRFEYWQHGALLYSHEQKLLWYCFTPYELINLFCNAGFHDLIIYADYSIKKVYFSAHDLPKKIDSFVIYGRRL